MSNRILIRHLSTTCFASGLPARWGGRIQLWAVWFGLLAGGTLSLQAARPEPTNWFSGDMHVHRSCGGSPVTIASIYNAMVAQDLSVVSVLADMGNGEVQNPTTDLPKVTGANDAASTAGRIVHWDAEWHWDATYNQYAHQALGGHLVVLGLTSAQQRWAEYTYPILDWARQQGGVGGFAHFQYLPASSFPQWLDCCTPIEYPVEVALGGCDFISQDVAGSDAAMLAYYRLLNCGFRPGFAGGSDYPCNATIGAVMTFVKVNGALTYRKWIDGIAAGNTVVSRNGRQEFLDLKVNTNSIPGNEISFPAGGGTVQVSVTWSAISSLSGTIELVHNGVVIANKSASVSLNNPSTLTATLTLTNSGWVAARRMGGGQHRVQTGAIFVKVDNKPVRASVADAQFYVDWMDQLLARTAAGAVWGGYFPSNRAQVQARYQAARSIYMQIAAEAAAPLPVSVITSSLPYALVNTAYATTLTASGGATPYTWSITGGQLPPGLSLNTNTGTISGMPNTTGTNGFTVQVRDAGSPPQIASRALSLTVGTFAAGPGLIGNTNTGTSSDTIWGGAAYINADRFQASSNMIVALLRAQVTNISGSYKCAIYTDSNSLPSRLLGFTVPVTNPATGWQTFPLTAPLILTNGNYYWLAIWSGTASARVYYSANNGTLRWGQYNYGDWPQQVNAPTGNTYNYSIYATGGSPPAFVATPTNRTIPELALLTVTNNATDSDVPWQTLTYSLVNPPTNAVISTNGVITWTPVEAQGSTTNNLVTVVNDGVVNVTNSFQVIVTEANAAPVFAGTPTNVTLAEFTLLTVTNGATDSDLPAQVLTYTLVNPPVGAGITNRVITWRPGEEHGGTTNDLITAVSDGVVNVTNSFQVIVTEVNEAPCFLATPANTTVPKFTPLTVTNNATDVDMPVQVLTYDLVGAPPGAVVSEDGVINWTPGLALGTLTNVLTTRVSDGSVNVTNSFVVMVSEVPVAPTIFSFEVAGGVVALSWSAISGQRYILECVDELTDTNWVEVLPEVTATGSAASMTNFMGSASQRFYRVKFVAE